MNATDKELLEMAARAAGYKVRWHERWDCFVHVEPHNIDNPPTLAGQRQVWLPLTDDGDALRLAVQMSLRVECYTGVKIHPKYGESNITDVYSAKYESIALSESHNGDPCSATRRAIVRAAAEIGKSMTKESDHEH